MQTPCHSGPSLTTGAAAVLSLGDAVAGAGTKLSGTPPPQPGSGVQCQAHNGGTVGNPGPDFVLGLFY
jgi:hypothetical protein